MLSICIGSNITRCQWCSTSKIELNATVSLVLKLQVDNLKKFGHRNVPSRRHGSAEGAADGGALYLLQSAPDQRGVPRAVGFTTHVDPPMVQRAHAT